MLSNPVFMIGTNILLLTPELKGLTQLWKQFSSSITSLRISFPCDDFSGGHDKKKKLRLTKNSLITLCLVNSRSWRVMFALHYYDATIPEDCFRQQLRVRRNTFNRILNLLGHCLGRQPSRFRDPLPPEKILALGLYCLDLGNSYVTIGPPFNVGKATAIEVDKMWWKPSTKFALSTLIFCKLKQTVAATETFVELLELPNIVGVIDGSLVTIKAPKDSAVDYFSRY